MSSGTGTVGNYPTALGRSPRGSAESVSGTGAVFHHWPLSSRLLLGSLPGAVPCARLHAKHILKEWSLNQITDNAEMIVSELATNALKASWSFQEAPPIALGLLANHEYLLIQVWDALSAPPAHRPHAIDAEGGRGLEIVSLLSDRWGFYHPDSGGKIVWAAIDVSTARGTPQVAGS
jgi:hypothetical protein